MTWRSSWFGEEGTRLLYLLPARLTDEILPLKISPQPDELVRVLVGRMEALTPEQAEQMAGMVRQMGTCASSSVEPLGSQLARLGRFAEPALEYVARTQPDADLRRQLGALVAELRGGE